MSMNNSTVEALDNLLQFGYVKYQIHNGTLAPNCKLAVKHLLKLTTLKYWKVQRPQSGHDFIYITTAIQKPDIALGYSHVERFYTSELKRYV